MALVKYGKYLDGEISRPFDVTFNFDSNHLFVKIIDINEVLKWEDLNFKDSFFSKTEMRLSFYKFPQKVLTINDTLVISEIEIFLKQTGSSIKKNVSYPLYKIFAVSLIFILLIVGLISSLPYISYKIAQQIPLSLEKELSQNLLINTLHMNDLIIENDEWKEAHTLFIKQLKYDDKESVEILLVDSKILNAFTLPGGSILITSAMVKKLPNVESYLGLIAHEIGHIEHHHIMIHIIENVIIETTLGLSFGDITGISAVLLNVTTDLTTLAYSRDMESEADDYAISELIKNEVCLKGMVDLFEVLSRQRDFPDELEFLSTHPITKNRLEQVQKLYDENPCKQPTPNVLNVEWQKVKQLAENLTGDLQID